MSTIGAGGVVGCASETTYGTYEATNDWLPVSSCTLTQSEKFASAGHLLPGGIAAINAVQRDPAIKVATEVGGAIEFTPMYDHRSLTLMLKHLMHSVAAQTGAGPYTYTYDIGVSRVGLSAQMIVGLSEALTATARRFTGLICSSWTFSADAGGVCKISSEWIGVDGTEMQSAVGTIAVTDSEEVVAAHMSAGSLTPWNSLALFLQSFSIKVDYKLARSMACGLYTSTKPALSDFTSITVSAKAQARSEAVHDAYLAGDTADFTVVFEGTSPNTLTFDVHNCKLTKCDLMLSTPGEIYYDLEWTAAVGPSESGLQVIVVNGNATAETP